MAFAADQLIRESQDLIRRSRALRAESAEHICETFELVSSCRHQRALAGAAVAARSAIATQLSAMPLPTNLGG